jgi:hypothetical protein
MTNYLLSMYYPLSPAAVPDNIDEIMARVGALTESMRSQGALVWTGGLAPSARVVTAGEPPLITDGPFLETHEALGGFWIIRADTPDAAEDWAAQASVATGLPIELRAFQM